MKLVDKMTDFANNAHKGQYRKGIKIPYITHCMEVMKRTSYYTQDESILCIALGHDILEDTDITYKEIKKSFNKRIADGILECTRESGDDADKLQKYEFLQSFGDKSMDSILVKIADRYCNVLDYRTSGHKVNYYSTYALQSYPLHRAYYKLAEAMRVVRYSVDGEHQIWDFDFVSSDLSQLNDWALETYPTVFDIAPTPIEDRIKQIVL
jgi:(p)ppGpp synthase/HD superfamily hydrolase